MTKWEEVQLEFELWINKRNEKKELATEGEKGSPFWKKKQARGKGRVFFKKKAWKRPRFFPLRKV